MLPSRSSLVWAGLLVLVTFVLYLRAATFDFLNYDDPEYVTENLRVQQGLSLANLKWAFTTGHASNWHPFTWVSHMLDWQLFGTRAGMHHLVNVLLHSVNSGLLFLGLHRFTGCFWKSIAVAAFFAWHPMHVESVAWVSERKDVLSAFAFFSGLIAYERYVKAKVFHVSYSRVCWWLAVLVSFTLAVLSKPTAVVFPLFLLLLDFWPLKRAGTSCGLKELVLEKLPLLVISLLICAITLHVQEVGGSISGELSLALRVESAFVAYASYLLKLVWPVHLAVFYPHPGEWPKVTIVASAALLIGVTTLVLFQFRRRPYLVVGWFWFLIGLAPVIGFVQAGAQFMADRYTYIPYVGLFLMLVWFFGEAVEKHPRLTPVIRFSAILTLIVCGMLAWNQLGFWKNSGTLFGRAVDVTNGNYLALNNLGHYHISIGQPEKAVELFKRALAIRSNYADALNNLGFALAELGETEPARAHFEEALRVDPRQREARYNLGSLEEREENWGAALEHYQEALSLDPNRPRAYFCVGMALTRLGRSAEATQYFKAAISLQPRFEEAQVELQRLSR